MYGDMKVHNDGTQLHHNGATELSTSGTQLMCGASRLSTIYWQLTHDDRKVHNDGTKLHHNGASQLSTSRTQLICGASTLSTGGRQLRCSGNHPHCTQLMMQLILVAGAT
jgi:hypothetical protein